MPTIAVTLEPRTEERLRSKAAAAGLSLEAYVVQLAERDAANGLPAPAARSFEEVTAPFAQAVQASGMTEEEAFEFFSETVKQVRAEKRAKNEARP